MRVGVHTEVVGAGRLGESEDFTCMKGWELWNLNLTRGVVLSKETGPDYM